MIKKIAQKKNYTIWDKFNRFNDACRNMRSYIDAGILESEPEIFRDFFVRAEALGDDFYQTLKGEYGKDSEFTYDIDFVKGLYTFDEDGSGEAFSKRNFVINSMDVKASYKKKITEALGK